MVIWPSLKADRGGKYTRSDLLTKELGDSLDEKDEDDLRGRCNDILGKRRERKVRPGVSHGSCSYNKKQTVALHTPST